MKTSIITVIVIIILIIAGYALYNSYQMSSVSTTTNTTNTTDTTNNTVIIPTVISTSSTPNTSAVNNVVTAPENYSVQIVNYSFNPASLTIKRGDSVTWINNDSAPHQISGAGFVGPVLSSGQSYKFRFNVSGTYSYICNIHPGMKGRVIVL